jgi:5-methyltetrahydrofolate--homocysteine methyltransferase
VNKLTDQKQILKKIRNSIVNFDVESIKDACKEAMENEMTTAKVIEEMGRGMDIVGKRYEEGDYFVPELIMAGETMKEGLEVLEPYMKGTEQMVLGTAIIATVLGDLHDIGKNIFITLLTTAGFKVIDLGVDVPADKIVQEAKEVGADIIGLSALLTTNLEQIPIVIEKLKKEGLRDKVKLIIGGAVVTESFAKQIGADGYAKDALSGVNICKNWVK